MSSRHHIFNATPLLGAAVLASGMLASGCSVQQPPAKEPLDAGVMSPDEAEAAFESAEQDLQSVLLAAGALTPDDDAGGADAPPPGQPGATSEQATGKQGKKSAASRCSLACKALASMERSATRLCDMAGPDDSRCQNVNHRVVAAQKLVRSNCANCSE